MIPCARPDREQIVMLTTLTVLLRSRLQRCSWSMFLKTCVVGLQNLSASSVHATMHHHHHTGPQSMSSSEGGLRQHSPPQCPFLEPPRWAQRYASSIIVYPAIHFARLSFLSYLLSSITLVRQDLLCTAVGALLHETW
jgi:hypothetical protein